MLLLVTTNGELGTLYRAVTSPRRCAWQVEFAVLSPARYRPGWRLRVEEWGRGEGIADDCGSCMQWRRGGESGELADWICKAVSCCDKTDCEWQDAYLSVRSGVNQRINMKGVSVGSDRRYWIVSPNVRDNRRLYLSGGASRCLHTRLSWVTDQTIGKTPAAQSLPAPAIASSNSRNTSQRCRPNRAQTSKSARGRRIWHRSRPVQDNAQIPEAPQTFGSLRILKPFIALTGPPPKIPLDKVLNFTKAMREFIRMIQSGRHTQRSSTGLRGSCV